MVEAVSTASVLIDDPITLEIQWQRLVTIMDEVDATVVRTSFSTIVGESRDFACVLMDANGDSLAQSTFSTPLFCVTLPTTARHLLAQFPRETLRDGDVLITNNPWFAAGHLPDVTVVTPVFRGGKLVAFMGTVAHVSDIGGRLGYYDARDVYEEGLCIPPMKLYEAGEPNDDLFRIIANNVRISSMVIGDLRAIVGAQWLGARRLNEFMDDYALDDINVLAETIHGTSESAMRRALRKLPEGEYGYHLTADGFAGVSLEIVVSIRIEDGSIINEALKTFMAGYGLDPETFQGTGLDVRRALQRHLRKNGEKMGYDFSELNDDQLTDDYHYMIFPNITFNTHCNSVMVFRQRPHPTDPNKMFYDVQNYATVPKGEPWPERPPHRQWKHGEDTLGEVLDQDASNLPMVQRGMNSAGYRGLWIGSQELRIRHFHKTLDDYIYRTPLKWVK